MKKASADCAGFFGMTPDIAACGMDQSPISQHSPNPNHYQAVEAVENRSQNHR